MTGVTTAIILDTRRAKKDGFYPVKLRVTFERKQQYFGTPYDLSQAEFDKVMFGKRLADSDKRMREKISGLEVKARRVIEEMQFFSFDMFEKGFFTNIGAKDFVDSAFTMYAKELRDSGRIGTAVSYECAQRSLSSFSPETRFSDITPSFLTRYEEWMISNGNSITTIGIYLRSLRTLFNNAISQKEILPALYPFRRSVHEKGKYQIPQSNNIKKALSIGDIEKIFNYQAEPNSMTERAKDYWIFMYLCNGINVKDMSLLKYENIKNDVIEFVRAKTSRTKRKIEPIRVPLTEDLSNIITKWGNKNVNGSQYIFPILTSGLTPERERQLIQQLTHVLNCHMKTIVKDLGISGTATTYAARHSFATILKRNGVSTEFISEALGHSSLRTTQSYLAGFEDESKREVSNLLTSFKKSSENVN